NYEYSNRFVFFFQAEDGIRDFHVTGVQTCALPIFESELVDLEPEEARELLESTGQTEPGLDRLASVGFSTLGLQTYLTAGPKESRAGTIPQGATAPEAAGEIHTHSQRGLLKAEIVSYDDLMEAGTMQAARAAGKVRMEGKDYVMTDGDVVEFRTGLTSGGKK